MDKAKRSSAGPKSQRSTRTSAPLSEFSTSTRVRYQPMDRGSRSALKPDEEEDGDEMDAFEQESVRQKMEVLAGMVGIEGSSQPAAVLGEVVRVLKELDRAREKQNM